MGASEGGVFTGWYTSKEGVGGTPWDLWVEVGLNLRLFSYNYVLLTIWAVKQLASDSTGHLVTNSNVSKSCKIHAFHVNAIYIIIR